MSARRPDDEYRLAAWLGLALFGLVLVVLGFVAWLVLTSTTGAPP